MSQWYLSKNGQALGPLEEDKVIALIKAGDVTPVDLVYKAGATEWLPLAQVDEFSSHFTKSASEEPKPKGNGLKEWVLLKKHQTEKGREYKQLGPFSEEQVLELIDQGEIRFTDFAWKKGLETWVKIAELKPFSQPLPSSPDIDMSLYDKTQPSIKIETITDHKEKASLTHLVSIEKFEHEKTVTSVGAETAPINSEDFATTSGLHAEEETNESGVSLWSLEPPSTKKAGALAEETVVPSQPTKEKSQKKKNKRREKKSQPLSEVNPEALQWAAVLGVVLLSAVFFYLSFRVDQTAIVYDQKSDLNQVTEQKAQPEPFNRDEISAKMKAYRDALSDVKSNLKREESITLAESEKPQPSPKVPLLEKIAPETKKVDSDISVVVPIVRKVAGSKNKAKFIEQAALMRKSKRTSKRKSVKRKKIKRARNIPVSKPAGGNKAQSYYKQRDRKALFYSSLKAETLAVEIESQYRKLKKNRGAWARYYGQWRKKVRLSLAKDIRNFPKHKEKYAYPKVIASFKKDYNLFYKYGESFNAKVTGSREPSTAPKNMRKLFSRYKKQSQGLGR